MSFLADCSGFFVGFLLVIAEGLANFSIYSGFLSPLLDGLSI